jgi:NAD-dependent deacetylase
VLYEEGLDPDVMNKAIDAIERADLLIIGGTSLNVYPAAGLIHYYRGERLVLVNKSEVARPLSNALVIRDPIGEVFAQL